MKTYLISGILVFSTLAPAAVILAERSDSLNTSSLKSICQQMTTNHLDDIQHMNSLYQELKALIAENSSSDPSADKVAKIDFLLSQIKEYSKRIQYLSKPEWNSESIPIELTWKVNYDIFYDDSQYLNLKKRIDDDVSAIKDRQLLARLSQIRGLLPFVGGGRLMPSVQDLKEYFSFKRNHVENKEITQGLFLNFENTDIKNYLFLQPIHFNRSEYETDRSFIITYKKNVTALEACQFLDTLLFEVEISYVKYLQGLMEADQKIKIKGKKTIFLIYKNEGNNE